MSNLANLRFVHGTERSQRAKKLPLPQAEHEIRLIFARIGSFPENGSIIVVLNNRIMPGCDEITAKRFGLFPKIPEFEFFITHHARIRRPAGLVLARKIIDHGLFELIGLIHYVMWDA